MKQFDITGMSCAACSARVEKAVKSLIGVTDCSVNLLTNSMSVDGSVTDEEIIKAVKDAGYGAHLKGEHIELEESNEFKDTETPILRKRLISSLIFLFILMYVSMGHTMWGFPVPAFFDGNFVAIGILQLLLAISVMIINKKFFTSGFSALIKRAPNMDTLVALGSGAAFVYSTYSLFLMTASLNPHIYLHDLYFESSAMILALITVGKMLEARSKGKTTSALKGLLNLAPKTAIVEINGEEKEVSAKEIKKGDIFIVKSGMSFPADGIIVSGHCAVDESALTGESIPVDKEMGDRISSATINKSGYVRCRAEKIGEDTTLSKIIKLVSDASATKAPIAKAVDKVSGVFVPVVIAISLLTIIIWFIAGRDIGFVLARGISVLVISCPCALGLATPVSIMVTSGIGAKCGILFKNAVSMETTGKARVVALDKTGTITKGEPTVTDIIQCDGVTDLLSYAYSLEAKSEHPLARAIVEKAQAENVALLESTDFSVSAGNGLEADISGHHIVGGNLRFISKFATVPGNLVTAYEKLAEEGKTPLFFTKDNEFLGIISVADTIKEDSPQAIKELKDMGMRVVMLTGDNEATANAVKEQVGADEVIANVTPAEKEKVIKELKSGGKVIMVGDGINDAPALTSADIGIAIGAGTDIAIDAADIVLMKNSILDIPAAIRLSKYALLNIYQNLFWAFVYNCISIPIAAGVLIPAFSIQLNPMIAAAAMSLSSFCVVSNALRLNFKDIYSHNNFKTAKEKKSMEITLKIDGMMCPHCEARVKSVLEEIDGVLEAIPSHTEKKAVVKLSKDVDVEILNSAIIDAGYKIID